MPPGRGLAEVVWRRLFGRQPKAPPDKKAIAELLQQRSTVYVRNATNSATASAVIDSALSNRRLLKSLTDLFSTLIHAPGTQGSLLRTSRRAARASSGSTLASLSKPITPFTFARSAHTGIRPRALPKSCHNSIGLQTARNFSSSRPVFDNIITNAPLGIRALGNAIDFKEPKLKELARNSRRRSQDQKQYKKVQSWTHTVRAGPPMFDMPVGLADYFPAASAQQATAVPSAQLVLPLSVSQTASALFIADSCCSVEEDSLIGHRLLDDDFVSQLWQLDESIKLHNNRVCQILDKLRSAGCFDEELGELSATASIRADFHGGLELVLTFYCPREVRDIRQIIGYWSDSSVWYKLVDLQCVLSSQSVSSTSLSSYDFSASDTPPHRASSVHSFDGGHFSDSDHLQQLRFPAPDLDMRSVRSNDTYAWGVHDFLRTIDHSDRPTF